MLHTHLEYLANDVIPEEYLPQLLWQLSMDPERQWNDFVSFHPDLPDPYNLFIKRLERTAKVDEVIRPGAFLKEAPVIFRNVRNSKDWSNKKG